MKKSKFTEDQIVFALKQAENGTVIDEICRKLGASQATFTIGKEIWWTDAFRSSAIETIKRRKSTNKATCG
jgi:putative transposase